jgi:hypothetical protein
VVLRAAVVLKSCSVSELRWCSRAAVNRSRAAVNCSELHLGAQELRWSAQSCGGAQELRWCSELRWNYSRTAVVLKNCGELLKSCGGETAVNCSRAAVNYQELQWVLRAALNCSELQ